MKLISWNTAKRTRRAEKQVAALLARRPDVVALQEVSPSSFPILKRCLEAGGLGQIVSAVPTERHDSPARNLGVMIASRLPLGIPEGRITVPDWTEKSVTASILTPMGAVEIHTVHVPPGRSHGWKKVDVFNAIYAALARTSASHRVLCGDFNSPVAELETGEVICAGKRLGKDGQWRLKRRHRGRPAQEWEDAESSVIVGLREFDLSDVFRKVNGYHEFAFSIKMKRGSTITQRRFDHIFASSSLAPVSCHYLHDLREDGLSDHAPIEAEFSGSPRSLPEAGSHAMGSTLAPAPAPT